MTEPLDLEALKALADAATPGPWKVVNRAAVTISGDDYKFAVVGPKGVLALIGGPKNAAAIAALPTLIARVRELEGENERLCRAGVEQREVTKEFIGDLKSDLAIARSNAQSDAEMIARLRAELDTSNNNHRKMAAQLTEAAETIARLREPQPIETAPKDGTSIIGFMGADYWVEVYFGKAAQRWVDYEGNFYNPSLWTPRPAIAKAIREGGFDVQN